MTIVRSVSIECRPDSANPAKLWVRASDLPRINEFELKPQGACRADLCIPVPKTMVSGEYFDFSAFAKLAGQAEVADTASRVWSYGEMPVLRGAFLGVAQRARLLRPRSAGPPRQAVGLPRQEGAGGHLGLLVRVPTRSARLADPLHRTEVTELRDHRRRAGHGRRSRGGQVVRRREGDLHDARRYEPHRQLGVPVRERADRRLDRRARTRRASR